MKARNCIELDKDKSSTKNKKERKRFRGAKM